MRLGLALLIAACGRIGFDPTGDGGGEAPAFARVALPAGGAIHDVVFSPSGARYAITKYQHAHRSLDGGDSWVACGPEAGYALALDRDGVLYLAGGVNVYESTDGCQTWRPTPVGRGAFGIVAVGERVFAATDAGVYARTGGTWDFVITPLGTATMTAIATNPAQTIVIAGADAGGMVRWDSDGPWQLVGTDLVAVEKLAIGSTGAGVTAAYAIDAAGTWCSADGGLTWATCLAYATAIAADPTDRDHVVLASYNEILDSTDRLATTTGNRQSPEMALSEVLALRFAPDGNLVAGTERGLFEAPAATYTWQPRLANLDTWRILDVTTDGDDVWVGTRSGVLHSSAGGPFVLETTGVSTRSNIEVIGVVGTTVFSAGRLIRLSEDRGHTWQEVLDPNDPSVNAGSLASAIASAGSTVYVGTEARVVRSTPPYTTWTPHPIDANSHYVRELVVRGSALWAACADGLFVSLDDAATFQRVDGLAAPDAQALALRWDASLVVGSSDGVWLSDPTATTWSRAGLPGESVHDLLCDGDTIVAATEAGVRASLDGGASWHTVTGVDGRIPFALARTADGALLAGTYGQGLFRAPFPR